LAQKLQLAASGVLAVDLQVEIELALEPVLALAAKLVPVTEVYEEQEAEGQLAMAEDLKVTLELAVVACERLAPEASAQKLLEWLVVLEQKLVLELELEALLKQLLFHLLTAAIFYPKEDLMEYHSLTLYHFH
jgi:hypothetical protein